MGNNSKDTKRLVLLLIASVSIIILIYCIIRLALYSLNSYKANKDIDELKEQIEQATPSAGDKSQFSEMLTPTAADNLTDARAQHASASKYRTLFEQNSDFAGWITIDGTAIDYPVMQTIFDEEYYLHRNFDKLSSDEGLPFIDAKSDIVRPSANIIIYGHNMKNGDMFADLLKYSDQDYYKEHRIVYFDTLFDEGTYEIISVFRADVSPDSEDDFKFYEFIENTDLYPLDKYLSEIKARSIYEIPFDPEKITNLITLSTCEYTKKDGRFVVIAAKTSA